MHYLYIIFSTTKDRFYVGETSDADFRLNLHNQHAFKKGYTKIATDWELVLEFECKNRTDALYLERFIKRMKSKKFIQKIVNEPQILNAILSKK